MDAGVLIARDQNRGEAWSAHARPDVRAGSILDAAAPQPGRVAATGSPT
jgi:hypothetical protein